MTEYNIYLLISLLPIAYAIASAIPVVATDITQSRVPNKITLPLILLNLVSMLGLAIWKGLWFRFGMVMLIAIVTLLVGTLVNQRGFVGMGDVKLFVALSMIIGWHNIGLGFAFLPIVLLVGLFLAVLVLKYLGFDVLKLSPVAYVGFVVILYLIK
jgi:Flp pilus assembly protein protease CpaA